MAKYNVRNTEKEILMENFHEDAERLSLEVKDISDEAEVTFGNLEDIGLPDPDDGTNNNVAPNTVLRINIADKDKAYSVNYNYRRLDIAKVKDHHSSAVGSNNTVPMYDPETFETLSDEELNKKVLSTFFSNINWGNLDESEYKNFTVTKEDNDNFYNEKNPMYTEYTINCVNSVIMHGEVKFNTINRDESVGSFLSVDTQRLKFFDNNTRQQTCNNDVLQNLVVPEGNIPDYAYSDCDLANGNLKFANLSNNFYPDIGESAFSSKMPVHVDSWNDIFSKCDTDDFYPPSVGANAFNNWTFREARFPDAMRNLGKNCYGKIERAYFKSYTSMLVYLGDMGKDDDSYWTVDQNWGPQEIITLEMSGQLDAKHKSGITLLAEPEEMNNLLDSINWDSKYATFANSSVYKAATGKKLWKYVTGIKVSNIMKDYHYPDNFMNCSSYDQPQDLSSSIIYVGVTNGNNVFSNCHIGRLHCSYHNKDNIIFGTNAFNNAHIDTVQCKTPEDKEYLQTELEKSNCTVDNWQVDFPNGESEGMELR